MSTAFENLRRVIRYLDSQDWHYDVDHAESIIDFQLTIESQLKSCQMVIETTDSEIISYGVAPINVPEGKRAAVAEFITRANYGLKIGCFEMDMDDGEVRYKSCLSTLDGVPSAQDLERHIDMPSYMLDRYGDGLLKIIFGFSTPLKAIRDIEG